MRDEFAAVRDEFAAVRGEFAAVRGELDAIRGGPRTPDTPSLMSLNREMRDEFAAVRDELDAIRGGPRTPDTPSLMSLQADIRSVHDLVLETSGQTMAQMRVLYEDLVDRIKVLGEGGGPRNPPA